MKTKSGMWRLAPVVLLIALAFASCKKDNETVISPAQDDIDVAADVSAQSAITTSQFDDILNITQSVSADDAGEDIGLGTESVISGDAKLDEIGRKTRCYTVTVVPKIKNQWPKTVTIDFGDGCTGKDGKVRKGKIVSIYTKPAFMPGAVVSTTFLGYEVDSFAVSGTHKVTNTSNGNKVSFKVEVIHGKITNLNTNAWRAHESNREFTQLDGWHSSLNPLKNGYKVTGWTKGANSKGHSWKTVTESPLVRKFSCKWISKGQLKIWWDENKVAATLDFGDGTCDDQAVLSYKGHTKIITLK